MGQALYRKYRSKSLREIVGQEHITLTLEKALASGRISHAYLFSGPRGVGKTSIARILAHEINGLPYTDDSTHMDIIEIDAASNNSVEDVRDLRERVYVAPSSAKYKVYIIDEVHMLSKAAFNALLKTLEEPPAHVVFILATTVASKLPDTIISRTQHYIFKPVEPAKVIAHLRHIARTEDVEIDDEALALLAAHGEGSFRDSISLLDQARSISSVGDQGNMITGAQVRQLLGIAPGEAIDALITAVGSGGKASELLQQMSELYGHGLQAAAIASQLSVALRSALASRKPILPVNQSLALMKNLIEVPASRSPERLLEIVLLEAADTSDMIVSAPAAVEPTKQPAVSTQAASAAHEPVSLAHRDTPEDIPGKQSPAKTATKAEVVSVATQSPDITKPLDDLQWPEILNSIKKEYNTLYGILRMTTPLITADGIELQCKFQFHQKRLNEAKNKKIIVDYIKRITGTDARIVCTYIEKPAVGAMNHASKTASSDQPQAVTAISNIFGSAEVLDA